MHAVQPFYKLPYRPIIAYDYYSKYLNNVLSYQNFYLVYHYTNYEWRNKVEFYVSCAKEYIYYTNNFCKDTYVCDFCNVSFFRDCDI